MRSRIVIIIVGLVVFITLGVILLATNGKKEKPEALPSYRIAADKFMSAMTSNKPRDSYDMLSSTMHTQIPYADWEKQINDSFGKNSQGFTFDKEVPFNNSHGYTQEQDPHSLIYNTTPKGEKWQTSILIFKRDGVWVIDDMKSYKQ